MKTAEEFKKHLISLRACDEAIKWALNKTAKEAWHLCERGDWLLWWAEKEKVNIRLLTLAKGKVAETVLHLMRDDRSKAAVYAAINFGNGNISLDDLNASYADAAASYADAAATYADAAAYAADAAASYADAAATYADAAADAAARSKARKQNQILTANIVREIIKPDFL